MVDVITSIIINRPKKEVFAYTINPTNAPNWYKNIKSVKWITEKPLKQGSQVAFIATFLGRTLSYVYEIKSLVPEEKLVMQTSSGPFLMQTTYLFKISGKDSTQVTLRNRGNPAGFSLLFSPFMTFAMKRANQKDLQKLKLTLEKQE